MGSPRKMVLLRATSVSSLTLAFLAIAGPLSSVALAGEIWDGGGGDNDWTTGANWNSFGPPLHLQIPPPNNGTANVHMAGATRLTPIVDVPYSINSLTFDNTAGAFVILGAQELTIGAGGVTNNDAQLQSLIGPVKLAADQTWSAAAGRMQFDAVTLNGFDLTLAGAHQIDLPNVILGAGDVTIDESYASTVTMSGVGSNTYAGRTTVDSGALVLQKGGVAVPGDLSIFGESVVRLAGNEQIAHGAGQRVTIAAGSLLDLNGHTETIAQLRLSAFETSGTVVTTGAGKLIIGDSVAVDGVTTSMTIAGNVDLGGGVRQIFGGQDDPFFGPSLLTFDGPMSNGGANFSGITRLQGSPNTFTGATTVATEAILGLNKSGVDGGLRGDVAIRGLVELQASEQILASAGNEVFLDGGGLQLNEFSETIQDLTFKGGLITGTGTLAVQGTVTVLPEAAGLQLQGFYGIRTDLDLGGSRTFNVQSGPSESLRFHLRGVVSNGSLVKTGPGPMELYGVNTYAGGTFLNQGVVRVAADVSLGDSSGAIHFDGGALGIASPNFPTTARTMIWGPNGGGFEVFSSGTFTINSQTITGPGPLTKLGLGKLTILAPQSYTGGTTVAAGTLEGHSQSLQGNIVNNASLVFNQTIDGSYGGNLSGAGAVTKLGAGALEFSGNNTYTGGTTINAGALRLAGGNAIGDLSAVTLADASGAMLDLAGSNEIIGSLSGGGASGGHVELGSGTLTTGANGASTTYGGVISGAGDVVKTGAGAWMPTGNNTYTGGTTFAGGTVSVQSDASLGGVAGPLRFDGGALRATGAFDTTSRAVELLAGGGVIDVSNASSLFTYASNMTGSGSLTKVGPGKLVLVGLQDYNGGTTVTAGALQGSSESLQGNIANHATVIFDQAGDGTYSGSLSGAGQLLKVGAGAVSLTGESMATGVITVEEGALRVINGGQHTGSSAIYVGEAGDGRLDVTGGSHVTSDRGDIGNQSGSSGVVTLAGAGSTWTMTGDLHVGDSGEAVLEVGAGAMVQAENIAVGALGVVSGNGQLVGDLQNGGIVSPGMSTGALRLEGNYVQSPTGELRVELASAADYDQLLLTQDASLGGALTVSLIEGFIPSAGQSFTLLTTDDVDFTFAVESLPSLPGLTFDVIYNPQSVVLSVGAALTGDFDNDGDVDGDDVTQWEGDFGVNDLSDADGDGDSDGVDFLAWQRQVGSEAPPTAAAAVPEPNSWLMAVALMAGIRRGGSTAGRSTRHIH